VDKNSVQQSIEKCQHPGEGTNIHGVEQVRPQGMKRQPTKQRNTSQQQELQERFTRQYGATIQRAIQVVKQNLIKKKYPSTSHNTTTELTAEYPVSINALLRKNF